MATDRNLLVGILAVQLNFVTKDQLVAAMNAWLLAKHRPLSELMSLSEPRRTLLEALVKEHLQLHDGDPQKSLAALSSVDSVKAALGAIPDGDVQASLATISRTVDGSDRTSIHIPRADASETAGGTASRFRILRLHARGGLGEVFVAEDTELNRQVALKEIQSRHAGNANSRGRFVLEAEVTGGLEHPNIVPVYGLGTYSDGRPYYAMRFIRGDSLKDAIEKFYNPASGGREPPVSTTSRARGVDTPRSPERNLAFRNLLKRFVDVCNAIAYAHSRGILHRDLKPGNIMLGKYGETLVVDWGLAKSLASAEFDRIDSSEATLKPSNAL